MIANEVLDAVPPHLIARQRGAWFERGVSLAGGRLALADRPLPPGALRDAASAAFPPEGDYVSEINPAAQALVAQSRRALRRRRAADHRLRVSRGRVLSSATRERHAGRALPPSRGARSAVPARSERPFGACRLQRHRARRRRRRDDGRRLCDAGALPDQLRHSRCAGRLRRSADRRICARRRRCRSFCRRPRWASCSRCSRWSGVSMASSSASATATRDIAFRWRRKNVSSFRRRPEPRLLRLSC